MVYETVEEFIHNVENGEEVTLVFKSELGERETVTGSVLDADVEEWTKVEPNNEEIYTVYSDEDGEYSKGTVVRYTEHAMVQGEFIEAQEN